MPGLLFRDDFVGQENGFVWAFGWAGGSGWASAQMFRRLQLTLKCDSFRFVLVKPFLSRFGRREDSQFLSLINPHVSDADLLCGFTAFFAAGLAGFSAPMLNRSACIKSCTFSPRGRALAVIGFPALF
jgi:hypothetical protein